MQHHLQDQILSALQQLWLDAATSAGQRVLLEDVDGVDDMGVPAIQIEAGPETVEAKSNSVTARTQLRTFDIYARVVVAQNANYRQAAGQLLREIEQAVHASMATATLDGLVADGLHLVATDPDRDGNSAKVTYAIRTLWRARYLCKENAPGTAL